MLPLFPFKESVIFPSVSDPPCFWLKSQLARSALSKVEMKLQAISGRHRVLEAINTWWYLFTCKRLVGLIWS